MQRVFIVEDDQTIVQAMQTALAKWQFQTQTVQDWQQVATEISAYDPDLVVMDITLPTFDGFYWTGKIRETSQVPIMFVSAGEMDPNAVRAIATGADDYIVKPFALSVFVSKIQAILRRSQRSAATLETLNFEDYSLNILNNELTHGIASVKLSPTEGTILKLFFLNPDQTLSKKQLVQKIWQGGLFIDEGVLSVNISRLREKLAKVDLRARLVTERGRGYRLVRAHG
ncbi:response regulator protein GraR [Agrilactobacillus composti DSM 18527 = JCM 14202]|uniref:Response regulator protein GraR n=1 Tax=Agrilactobacillus composti DSM 18527 = JCM 14202 TaxID=1423734 RepID=X0PT10_9LACO|nr:response regulator transcription factor [Agrilactobacillus composti]KRM31448.1 response regulator protein GraR [Agrilactobacillus composti DSM 18527 = JCM 14202]GAF40401.1 DNA-binding response regulator [Agrilactobacillus composti DSM 18527 = JCM 14202]